MAFKYGLSVTLLLLSLSVYAQDKTALLTFNQKRLHTNKMGMLSLGSWALLNIGTGTIASRQASGSNKYFHQMNAYWNVVNLTLAGVGYYGSATADPASYNLFASIREQYGMEKILLLNTGLDAAYIATGLYLLERAQNSTTQADWLKGFGQAVILQGSFLLLFDAALYLIHHSHIRVLKNIIGHISMTGSSAGVYVYF